MEVNGLTFLSALVFALLIINGLIFRSLIKAKSKILDLENEKDLLEKETKENDKETDQESKVVNLPLIVELEQIQSEVEVLGQEKSDILAIVSHDLKQPISVIETSMDILLEEERNRISPNGRDLIIRSKKSAELAFRLVKDLLDLSFFENQKGLGKNISLDFEKFYVRELIESVVDSNTLAINEKELKIVLEESEDHLEIIADYGRLVQVFNNLIGNAIKFSPIGGKLTVSWAANKMDHFVEGSDLSLSILIKDQGPGIPQDKRSYIFNKFSQVNSEDRQRGSGLGLAIAKAICEGHEGDISISDSDTHYHDGAVGPNTGTGVLIHLPRVWKEAPRLLNEKERSQILLIEKSTVKDFYAFLVGKNSQVETSFCGLEEDLASFKVSLRDLLKSRNFDLVILGSQLPDDTFSLIAETLNMNVNGILRVLHIGESKFNSGNDDHFLCDSISEGSSYEGIFHRIFEILHPEISSGHGKYLIPNKRTILVVDDEDYIRSLTQENFLDLGFNCLSAKNGIEALYLYQKYCVDLIVSDLRMKDVDGLTLTKMIKKEEPDFPIILMSANVSKMSESLIQKLRVSKLFSKPFDFDEMNDFIIKKLEIIPDLTSDRLLLKSEFKEKEGVPFKVKVKKMSEKTNVLLVDDSEDMRTLFAFILKDTPYEVVVVENGVEALKLFDDYNFECIFMDRNMPLMDGLQCTLEWRKKEEAEGLGVATPIVLLTADEIEEEEGLLEKYGVNDYLGKPFKKENILTLLANYRYKS